MYYPVRNYRKLIWVTRGLGCTSFHFKEHLMDSIIYLVGLVVVIMAILSFLGLH